MIKRGPLFFAGLVAVVVAYAAYDYFNEKKEAKQADEKSRFLQMDPDQINEFSISTPSTVDVVVVKQKEGWRLKAPIEDEANQKVTDEFIDGLATEKSQGVAVEGVSWDPKNFGLDLPQVLITVKNYAGDKVRFTVGRIKNFQGDAFVQINEEKKILIGSSTWFNKGQRRADDFRDKRWMRQSAATVQKLDFQKFQLIKEQDQWISPQQKSWQLDQNRIREILAMLNASEGIEVIADPQRPATQAELKKWGLLQPRMHLKVTFKEGSWAGKFGAGDDKVQRLQVTPPALVFKISPTDADKFANLTLDSLRDRHKYFLFDKQRVQNILLNVGGLSHEFKMENGLWKSNEGVVDQDKVRNFLQMVSNLSVAQFENAVDKNLHQEMILQDETGRELFRLKWGDGAPRVSAKSSLSALPFLMLEKDLSNLRFEELVLKKEETK